MIGRTAKLSRLDVKRISFVPVLLLLMIFVHACGDGTETPEGRQSLMELLPRDGDISGWQRDGTFSEASNYTSLYDLIDGAADRFIDYGFVSSVFQNYRDESGLQIELRIYEMDSEVNARRIYDELVPASMIPWVDVVETGRIDNSAIAAYTVEFQYEEIFAQCVIYEKSDRSLEVDKLFASHVIDLIKAEES